MCKRQILVIAGVVALAAGIRLKAAAPVAAAAQAPIASRPCGKNFAPCTGEEVFRAACITCHGPNGQGQPRSRVGFAKELPDFSDCAATTPEVEHDWFAVVYNGGPIRAFDRHMPSFAGALSEQEIRNVVHYLRTFCGDRKWPPGELNLPRPLLTEKAFPENEAVVSTSISRRGGTAAGTEIAYEHRLGSRTQYEIAVPIEMQHPQGSDWSRGVGDIAFALKRVLAHDSTSIFSAGVETAFPTGSEAQGLGSGVTTFEPFVAYGRMLPFDAFVQAQGGFGLPTDTAKASREAFWRAAVGRTFYQNRFGRQFSPMLELTGAKAFADGEPVEWDVVPEVQVSLSKLQHVRLGLGLQMPVTARDERGRTFHLYILWDWFDGPLFSGW
jgi:mono/diheme cytochrome c family protein